MPPLENSRHELFAQALAAGKTADQAYADSGYAKSRPHASRLATKGNVRDRVQELQSRATKGVILTRQWVLERLVENANRAMQAEPPRDKEGNVVGEYKYEGSVANRALELLGKELGMFVERQETGAPGSFKELSDAELERELVAELVECGVDLAKARAFARSEELGAAPAETAAKLDPRRKLN